MSVGSEGVGDILRIKPPVQTSVGVWTRDANDVVSFAGGGVLAMKARGLLQFAELCASSNVMSNKQAPVADGVIARCEEKFMDHVPFLDASLVSVGKMESDLSSESQSKIAEPLSHPFLERKKRCGFDFEQGFPKSIFNFVMPSPVLSSSSSPSGVVPLFDEARLRTDKEGSLPSYAGKNGCSLVWRPNPQTYPFAKLLPGQCIEVRDEDNAVVTVEPSPSIPVLEVCGNTGVRCFCGRPSVGALDRYTIKSSDPVQAPLLRSAAVKKLLKREHDFFCDYICLAKYVCGTFRAKPYKGDRLVVVNELLVQALEGFASDVIPSLIAGRPYMLSPTQMKLLSGCWPLCEYAARSIFKEAVSQAETFRLVNVLQAEINFRKILIGDDDHEFAAKGRDDVDGDDDESSEAAEFGEPDQFEYGLEDSMDLWQSLGNNQGNSDEELESFDSPW